MNKEQEPIENKRNQISVIYIPVPKKHLDLT